MQRAGTRLRPYEKTPSDNQEEEGSVAGATRLQAQMVTMHQRLNALERENGMLAAQLQQVQGTVQVAARGAREQSSSVYAEREHISSEMRAQSKTNELNYSELMQRLRRVEEEASADKQRVSDFIQVHTQEQLQRNIGPVLAQAQQEFNTAQERASIRESEQANDIAGLKWKMHSVIEGEKDIQEAEKRKGQLLYGEVVRLGEHVANIESKTVVQQQQLQEQVRALQAQLQLSEQALHQVDNREVSHAVGINQQAESQEMKLQQMNQDIARLNGVVHSIQGEKQQAGEIQQKWAQNLQQSFTEADSSLGDRIAGAIQQIVGQIASNQQAVNFRFNEQQEQQMGRESSQQAEQFREREGLAIRLKYIEDSLANERMQSQMELQDQERRLREYLDSMSGAVTKNAADIRANREFASLELQKGVIVAQQAAEQMREYCSRKLLDLEEVTRGEIKSRMLNDTEFRSKFSTTVSALSSAIETVQLDAATSIQKLDLKADRICAEAADEREKNARELESMLKDHSKIQNLKFDKLQVRIGQCDSNLKVNFTHDDALRVEFGKLLAAAEGKAAQATETVAAALVEHQEVTDIALKEQKSLLSIEMKDMAQSLRNFMELWATDGQAEMAHLRDEVVFEIDNVRMSIAKFQSTVQKQTSTLADNIIDIEKEAEIAKVMASMINHLDDENEVTYREASEQQVVSLSEAITRDLWSVQAFSNELSATLQSEISNARALQLDGDNELEIKIGLQGMVSDVALAEHKTKHETAMSDIRVSLNNLQEEAIQTATGLEKTQASIETVAALRNLTDEVADTEATQCVAALQQALDAKCKILEGELSTVKAEVGSERMYSRNLTTRVESISTDLEAERKAQEQEWIRSVALAQETPVGGQFKRNLSVVPARAVGAQQQRPRRQGPKVKSSFERKDSNNPVELVINRQPAHPTGC
jgi:hypothetical protein